MELISAKYREERGNGLALLASKHNKLDRSFPLKLIGFFSKAVNTVKRLTQPQDVDTAPASNLLLQDPDLSTIGCALLPDYDVIICRNVRDAKICGQAIPLGTLMAHCYSDERRGVFSSHKILSCKRVNDKATTAQKEFLGRLLIRYPNIVVTQAELKDVRMRPNQFGPVSHVPVPVGGYACNHCDFATASLDRAERLLKKHWETHVAQDGAAPLPRFKKGSSGVLKCDKFQHCQVQTLSTLHTTVTWLKVPSGHPSLHSESGQLLSQTSSSNRSVSSGQILAAFHTSNSTISSTINRNLTLPFFRDIRAVDFIQRIDPDLDNELVSLPTKHELLLSRLKRLCVKRFTLSCEDIKDAPIIVQEALVQPKEYASPLFLFHFAKRHNW